MFPLVNCQPKTTMLHGTVADVAKNTSLGWKRKTGTGSKYLLLEASIDSIDTSCEQIPPEEASRQQTVIFQQFVDGRLGSHQFLGMLPLAPTYFRSVGKVSSVQATKASLHNPTWEESRAEKHQFAVGLGLVNTLLYIDLQVPRLSILVRVWVGDAAEIRTM